MAEVGGGVLKEIAAVAVVRAVAAALEVVSELVEEGLVGERSGELARGSPERGEARLRRPVAQATGRFVLG